MNFLRELSMEAYLIENPDVLILDNDDLSTVNILDTEVPIKGGRIGKKTDGRIDLLAAYGESTLGIIELKLGELNNMHLEQLEDYLNETNQLEKLIEGDINKTDLNYIGVLVGSSINPKLAEKIEQGYLIKDTIPVAALTLKRYRGEDNNIYIITDTFFKNISRKFDRTKYIFNKEKHGKNRLVLAVIKKYVEENPEITFSKLEKVFPPKLQGSWGCFATEEKAQEIYTKSNYKRFFLKPEEIIEIHDSKISVCSQWGLGNIHRFIEAAKSLGYEILMEKE